MQCPSCDTQNKSKVVDTYHDSDGGIRRRRQCKDCGTRYTTYEQVMLSGPTLRKRNGQTETFDRDKLAESIQLACGKQPITQVALSDLVEDIEIQLQDRGEDEVPSRLVGDLVMRGLKDLDAAAYVRYAVLHLGSDRLDHIRNQVDLLLTESPIPGEV